MLWLPHLQWTALSPARKGAAIVSARLRRSASQPCRRQPRLLSARVGSAVARPRGLTLVREILSAHGFDYSLHKEPDQPTTFTIVF
jgi:hypothetical protein